LVVSSEELTLHPAPKGEWELSPEADEFGGLEALDKLLEGQ
jgi:hypothetical protein